MLFPLLSRKTVAENTTEVSFEIPTEHRELFIWKAGQYVDITIPSPKYSDARGASRMFSITSAPHESPILSITFRNSESAWKRHVCEMNSGELLEVQGPFGFFTLPRKHERDLVFIAGGVGIVPFISMFRHMKQNTTPHKAHLLYANSSHERAAYHKELLEISSLHTNTSFTLHIGSLTEEAIQKASHEKNNPLFYIAGPSQMAWTAAKTLEKLGTDPLSILTEEFTGY